MADKQNKKNAEDIIRVYGGYSGDKSEVVFDSRNPGYRPKAEEKGTSKGAAKAAEILNKINQHSNHIQQNLGIWREVNPGYRANTSGQAAIEGLLSLKNMTEKDDLIVYDTEILGTAPNARKTGANMGFYSPTEIGFQHVKMVNGKLERQDKNMSMLMRPTHENHRNLEGLINKANVGQWTGMTPDERRTLSDLMLYAGDAGKLFTTEDKDGRKVTTVNSQARDLHPQKGSVLPTSNNIALMKQGLNNLMTYGTKPEDAILEMNAFMKGMSNVRMGGYNVFSFDQPMMMDYLNNQVGAKDPNSKVGKALDVLKQVNSLQQIDTFHAARTFDRESYSNYGKNMRLESTMDASSGQAHHALSDVGATIDEMNRQLSNPGINKVLETGGVKGTAYGSFNNTPIEVGDRLFGRKGMNARDAGEYDGVFRTTQSGAMETPYDMKMNPLYRNTTYRVDAFYNGVEMDGQKMFGVKLFNEVDEMHHVIMRDSKEALQDAIHGHLDYIRPKADRAEDLKIQGEDRAARKYRKMFSTDNGGGTQFAERLFNGLDVVREGEKAGLDKDSIKQRFVESHQYNTPELFRDFETMRPRLEAEEKWIRGFLTGAKEKLGGDEAYNQRSRDMAFSEFGRLMDHELGQNTHHRPFTNGEVGLNLKTGAGNDRVIRVNSDPDSVRQSLYGHLYDKHAGKPHMADMKKDFRDLLYQLKSYDALSAKKYEQMYNAIDQYRPGESIDNLLSELSNEVVRARETNSLNGELKGISVEDPTRVHGTRAERLRDADFFNERFESVKGRALSGTNPYQAFWSGKDGAAIPIGGSAKELLNQHDQAIQKILDRNNLGSAKVSTERAQNSINSLTNMVQAYTNQGMKVQIRHDKERSTLQMVLAAGDASDSLLNGSMEDIRKSNQTAVIELPKINPDGTISLGGQNRVSNLKAKRMNKGRGGGYEVVTAFDEIMGSLAGSAKYINEMYSKSKTLEKKNGMLQVESQLNKRALKGIQSLSSNNKYGNPADQESMYDVRSQGANWVRTGHVDISDSAEDWYTKWYDQQSPERRKTLRLKPANEVLEKAQKNNELFVNEMGSNARNIFQRQVDDYLKETTGMDLGMHSVKDTHVSNYIRSNLDTRDLLAFGKYNAMARENISKTVNYLAIDREETEDILRRNNVPEGKAARLTKRGLMSTTAAEVMEEATGTEKLSFLNMRTAYMTDKQLAERVTDTRTKYENLLKGEDLDKETRKTYEGYVKQLNSERISVYDGMMVMSTDVGEALSTKREKKVTLKEGATFTPEMQEILDRAAGGRFDPSESTSFSALRLGQAVDTSQIKEGQKFTVSEIVKQELDMLGENDELIYKERRVADQQLKTWNLNRMETASWDAESRVLTFKERSDFGNSTKVLSEDGLRGTATGLERKLMQEVAGADVDMISPVFEPAKKLHGTEIKRLVAFAVDEALAQTEEGKKTTVGSLTKDQALMEIDRMMRETFNIREDMTVVTDNQILIDSKLGHGEADANWTYSDLGRFSERLSSELGIVAEKDGIRFGNEGVARHDVFDWENGIGLVDEHRVGVLKYGRKEQDMISTRFTQELGKGSQVVNWLQSHIKTAAAVQSPEMDRVAAGLFRIGREDSKYAPKEGDVVIKTRSDMGASANRIEDGVRYISMNEVNALPEATMKHTKFATDHYAGTIIDPQGMRGKFDDGVSYGDAVTNANARTEMDADGNPVKKGGTSSFLIEMPDDTFAKDYMRTVDFGDFTKGGTMDTPMMRDLQKTQMQIWRNVKEYQELGEKGEPVSGEQVGKIRERVNELMVQYEDQAVKMTTNARDNGLMKSLGAAKMDMSGRFRIQGVNPYGNYESIDASGRVTNEASEIATWRQKKDAKYKEGVAYMSRDRVSEMIKGAEKNIAQTMIQGLDADAVQKMGFDKLDDLSEVDLHKKVLDNVNSSGLYGLVNRYPTIKQSTLQAMKIEIDGDMAPADRGARLTIGTSIRLKADFDGDFLSTMLAHYGAETHDVNVLHNEMKSVFQEEQKLSILEGVETMKDIDKDVNNIAKTMNMTVGDLAKEIDGINILGADQRTEKQQTLMNLFNSQINSRLRDTDSMETREARLGKEFVGRIDNTRDKVTTLATATVERLAHTTEGGAPARMSRDTANLYRNSIEDFMATFSQELISSKKFDIDTEIARQIEMDPDLARDTELARTRAKEAVNERHVKVLEMNEAMMNPTTENLDIWRQNNAEIGLFQGEANVKTMNETLERIRDVALWNGRSGGYNNVSLRLGVSEGITADQNRDFVNGKGQHIVRTAMTEFQAAHMDDTGSAIYREGFKSWESSIFQGFDDVGANGSQNLADTLTEGPMKRHSLDGATLSERSSGSLRGIASQFMPSGGGGAAGLAGGAVAFGALWAASAFARSGPTPEGLREQTQNPIAPVASSQLTTPTARVTENNGEHINIRVSAKGASGMSEQDVSALVHQEISAMTTVNMNTTMNVNDNTQNIDQQWLQGIIANAMNKGIGF